MDGYGWLLVLVDSNGQALEACRGLGIIECIYRWTLINNYSWLYMLMYSHRCV